MTDMFKIYKTNQVGRGLSSVWVLVFEYFNGYFVRVCVKQDLYRCTFLGCEYGVPRRHRIFHDEETLNF